MAHIHHHKLSLQRRLRRIRGQVDAIEHYLGGDADCRIFLHQVASIRGAVDGLIAEVLENHIREHLEEVREPSEQRQQDLEEIISVIKTYLK